MVSQQKMKERPVKKMEMFLMAGTIGKGMQKIRMEKAPEVGVFHGRGVELTRKLVSPIAPFFWL